MFYPRKYNTILSKSLSYFPVLGIIGPRQVGKTTFIKSFLQSQNLPFMYLDLELNSDLFKLSDAESFLLDHRDKLIVIDEFQHRKDLFPLIRALIDKDFRPARYILLGSASPDLIRDSSESLAGRIQYIQMHPFDLIESEKITDRKELWYKGGYPRALLAPDSSIAYDWIQAFVKTYLEKDLPQLGLPASPLLSNRLWIMLAHLNGQVVNNSLLAKSLEISSVSVKTYIDFFENAFLIRRLYPYSKNTKKRLVKSPKLYFTDTGILHFLLNIKGGEQLYSYPAVGNSWEAFCIQQLIANLPDPFQTFFYRSQDGAECDLVITVGGSPVASVEIKMSNSPKISKGNLIAIDDIGATLNFILTPDSDDFFIKKHIRVCSLIRFLTFYLPEIIQGKQ